MGFLDKLSKLTERIEVNMPGPANPTRSTVKPNSEAAPAPEPQTSAASNDGAMYDPQLEQLIEMALADGELTDKEKLVLFKRAQMMGIDLDEFEMVLDARLYKMKQQRPQPSQPFQAPGAASASNKYGDLKKCPACGEVIESFTTRCPLCGHAFSNIAANSSIQKLFEMLNEVEAESKDDVSTLIGGLGRLMDDSLSLGFGGNKDMRRKKAIIQNFPIPTTKDDILEFLSLAVPLARKPKLGSEDRYIKMYEVWHAKCEQVIMKAKFAMHNDPKTLSMIAEYAKELKIKM